MKLSCTIQNLLFSSLVCWMGLIAIPAQAVMTFSAPIGKSQWYLDSSIFGCSLTQPIPNFGKGVFYREAGERLKFMLTALDNPLRTGKASLVLKTPDWNPGGSVYNLRPVYIKRGPHAVEVTYSDATKMVRGLLQGLMPVFYARASYGRQSVRVEISPVNFSSFYSGYINCVSSLLPINFRQVERSKVFFVVNKAILTKKDKQTLDDVITYVKADKTVSAIYVDGHTDSTGRRIYNRRLSKVRADAVTKYFIEHGLSTDMITTRYHGERYPVVKNDTPRHRAMNRRTTVRLVRGELSAKKS